jgi:hypothetical protein
MSNIGTESKTPSASPQRVGLLGDEPTHSSDGVDLTLIRWMLSLTPAERLHVLQQSVESLLSLLDASANR